MKVAALLALFLIPLHAVADGIGLPTDERRAIDQLVDKLFANGLPDTKGAKYFVGPARVTQRFDPDLTQPLLPMEFCVMQSTVPDSKEMEYVFEIPGPHFELRDGRWLLGLDYLIDAKKTSRLQTKKGSSRKLAGAAELAREQFPYAPAPDFDEWFANVSAPDLQALKDGVKNGVPLWQYFQLPRNDTAVGVMYLLRAGAEDASVLSYTVADTRCRDYWRMNYWSGEEGPFDPTGKYAGLEKVADIWQSKQEKCVAESPSQAFRRDLHRYFFYQLRQPNSEFSDDTLAALATATLDPDDPQHLAKRLQMLVASKRIAETPPPNATLVDRLKAWGAPQSTMKVTNTPQGANPGLTTVFEQSTPAYEPKQQDLQALFALLDDDRPTRFVDYQGARTVGENALRAIAVILDTNPLSLVESESLEPWTPERRRTVNRALLEWWKSNQDKYRESNGN